LPAFVDGRVAGERVDIEGVGVDSVDVTGQIVVVSGTITVVVLFVKG